MKIKEILDYGINELRQFSDVPRNEMELLVMHVLGLKKIDLLLYSDQPVTRKDALRIKKMIKKRIEGVPLQHLIGTQEFMGLEFIVTKDVLIPRQDTEILVEAILEKYKNQKALKILEIGVGSGAISVSLAKYLEDVRLFSIDVSKKALEVARLNAIKNKVEKKITFIESDLFEALTADESFDIIVSNPPYIPSKDIIALQREVKDYEPMLALDGGKDGLYYYREISKKSVMFLKPGGLLAYEIGYNQGTDVSEMLRNNFRDIEIKKDLQKHDRVVLGYRN